MNSASLCLTPVRRPARTLECRAGSDHANREDTTMSLAITADKALIWDQQQTKMVQKPG